MPLYLASGSPRRAELLQQAGFAFERLGGDLPAIDETPWPGESPFNHVRRLATEKARAALRLPRLSERAVVLGADTVVVDGERILGKPADEATFLRNLLALSGRSHEVMTAVAVAAADGRLKSAVNVTRVTLGPLDEARLRDYWRGGEPVDKAGGYAIQGQAAVFVEHIEGSYSAVMGLPLFETARLLAEFDLHPGWVQQ